MNFKCRCLLFDIPPSHSSYTFALMKQLIVCLLLIIPFTWISHAQETDTLSVDSTEEFDVNPRLVLNLDARRSFIRAQGINAVKISGIKAGIQFGHYFRTGIGIYDLTEDIVLNNIYEERDEVRLDFAYIATYFEYLVFVNKRWEFSLQMMVGFGNIQLSYKKVNGTNAEILEIPVTLIEISEAGHYRIFSWIGLGAGLGWRRMINAERTIDDAFNGPIYIFKIKLFLRPIFEAIFKKKD